MTGKIPTLNLWRSTDESAIFSAINNYLGTVITYNAVEQHYDVIGEMDVDEWRVGDKCWRIITRSHKNSDDYVHEYSVSMYLLDWNSRPYVYDYDLTSAMATDKLHFLIKIDTDDNTWDIEEILDPIS
jgi:hypothetical protein